MKRIIPILILFLLCGCSPRYIEDTNENKTANIEALLDRYDIEKYLMFNNYYNLIFDSIDTEDETVIICNYHSYLPITVTTCTDTLISVKCNYDSKDSKFDYTNISTKSLGTIKQPNKTLYLDICDIGLNSIEVPFSWNLDIEEIDYNDYLNIGNLKPKNVNKIEQQIFNFWNDEVLTLNFMTTADPFNPDHTVELNTGNYKLTFNESVGLLKNNSGNSALFKITDEISYEDRLAIISTIKPVLSDTTNSDPLNDIYIDYSNSIFNIKLLYNMRIRSQRNQHDNVIAKAAADCIYPVYKVINDGKFIWYCIGKNMWIGDDGTCIEKP